MRTRRVIPAGGGYSYGGERTGYEPCEVGARQGKRDRSGLRSRRHRRTVLDRQGSQARYSSFGGAGAPQCGGGRVPAKRFALRQTLKESGQWYLRLFPKTSWYSSPCGTAGASSPALAGFSGLQAGILCHMRYCLHSHYPCLRNTHILNILGWITCATIRQMNPITDYAMPPRVHGIKRTFSWLVSDRCA